VALCFSCDFQLAAAHSLFFCTLCCFLEPMKREFADCIIDPGRHEFSRGGEIIKLEPQVFDLIALLADNPGRLLTRDDLVDAIWGGRIVSESTISARINAARRAVGDDGKRQEIIETVARRGIRLVSAVSSPAEVQPAAAPRLAEAEPPEPNQIVRFTRSSDGARIAYATMGNGPPMLRAGVFLGHLDWEWRNPVFSAFYSRLMGSFTLTRYDQRGAGLSDRNPPSLDFERYVDDLEAVADAAGLEQFTLFGASQSAPVCIAFAVRRPERVGRLIIAGGFAQGRMARASDEERAKGEAVLTMVREGWGNPEGAFMQAFATLYMPDGTPEQISSIMALQRAAATPEMAVRIRREIDTWDVTNLLPNVQAPTLVLHWSKDAVQPFEEGLRIAEGIPNAQFSPIESRNHVFLPQDENWKALDAIEAFASEG
jgi:pimeloyl-ACP methyl ester carboxylesterase